MRIWGKLDHMILYIKHLYSLLVPGAGQWACRSESISKSILHKGYETLRITLHSGQINTSYQKGEPGDSILMILYIQCACI